MATDVLMPVLTEAGEDGVVTAWMVDEGGACEAGQLIAEVQVEKVAEDVLAPESGVVVGRVAVNQPVPQGEPICRIMAAEEAASAAVEERRDEVADVAPARHRLSAPSSPAARRLAGELGVDLTAVTGSGPGGRITESDVRAAAGGGGPAAAMTGLRAVIARNMRRGHLETAPVTLTTEVDLGSEPPQHVTAAVIRAAALTLKDHPRLNGTRDGDRFTPAEEAHISVAIQTDEGLVSPVVRSPAELGVEEIHEQIRELAERARAGELKMSDYQGGTFTVTNLGGYGIDGFTPIINLPQVAVLGVGAARRVPLVTEDGAIAPGWRMTLSLTFDHAFVDGAPAASFLGDLGGRLAEIAAIRRA